MVHIEKLKNGKYKVVIGDQTWGIYSKHLRKEHPSTRKKMTGK